jgi:urea transport system substrate-binding protein
VTTRLGVPFIYSMDGELKTCRARDPNEVAKFVWGAGFTERMIVPPFFERLAASVIKARPVKVYFLGGDYVYPRATNAFARSVAEEMKFEVVGDEYTDVSTADYTPVIRRIARSGANLLIVTNPGSAAATFMRQARQFGLGRSMVITGFATFAQETVGEMGGAAEGAIYANRYSDLLETPVNAAFVAAFRKRYPDRPLLPGPTAAAGAYGAMVVAAQAYAKAESIDPDAFAEAMKGLRVNLPQGQVVVDPTNNIFDQHLYLLKVVNEKYKVLEDMGEQKHPGLVGCSVK